MMDKYEAYKDSGIPWIGEIPSHWKIKKVSHVFTFNTGFTPPTSNDDFYVEGTHTWVNISDLNGKYVSESGTKITDLAIQGKPIVPKGSLLYSFKLSVGKMAFTTKDLYTNEAIFAIFPADNLNLNYYHYLLDRILIHNANENIYGAKILNQELIKSSKLLFPPAEEQTAIATFLDRKTSEIDTLINKKKQLIELLKEERTAIINHAVTKGIDPNVKYKDSGIEWIGEIPEHWEVKPLKSIANIQGRVGFKGYTVSDLVSEGEGPYTIGAKHIDKDNLLDLSKPEYISWHKYYESPEIMVQTGDILLTQRGTLGKVALIRDDIGEATINPSMVLLNRLNVNSEYLYYFFNSSYFITWVDFNNTATAVPMISQFQLGNFKLVVPDDKEQLIIANYLSEKMKDIYVVITKVETEIKLMQEYKTALISEVVTGKVDVREEVMETIS